jgi:CBS domain-containing protein
MQTVRQLLDAKGSPVYIVSPGDTVLHAIELMATERVGALLVMDQGTLLGIISERDYARKVILKNQSSQGTPVGDIMSSPAITVTPEDSVHHCMEIMIDRRIRHLPVVKSGRVIGMLSMRDLVKAVIQDQREHIEQLERYIAG